MRARMEGLTLVELMVALALGMLVAALAIGSMLASRTVYLVQDETAQLQDAGRTALEVMARAVRQAAAENWEREGSAIVNMPESAPSLSGNDDASLRESGPGIDKPVAKAFNGSDVLAVRFIGSGAGPAGDGTRADCAGFTSPEPADWDTDRGWSIFYVATDKSGEPELRCKYRGKSGWNSEALVRGVESFQALYGIDTDGDGLPNQYWNASRLNEADAGLAVSNGADRNRRSIWKKVVAVKLAVLIRSAGNAGAPEDGGAYDLFGKAYSQSRGGADPGVHIEGAKLPAADRRRLRKVFVTTVWIAARPRRGSDSIGEE